VHRTEVIGEIALDAAADTLLAIVDGGVALVPLARSSSSRVTRIDITDVRGVLACAGRRYATSFVGKEIVIHDITGVTAGKPPPTPRSSPIAALTALKWPRLSCGSDRLAVTTDGAVFVLAGGAAPVRVPITMDHPNDALRDALPLANGDLLTLSGRGHLRVLDRAGKVKAIVSADAASLSLTPDGARVIAGSSSFALPNLDDAASLAQRRTTVVALDARRALALGDTGLREGTFVTAPPSAALPRTLAEPRVLARRGDGARIAVGEDDGDVVIFERAKAGGPVRPVATLRAHRGGGDGVIGLAFLTAAQAGTANDVLVTVGDDDLVHVFDERTWTRVRSVAVPEAGARSVAVDPARGLVAIGGYEMVSIVDVKRGALQRVIGPLPRERYGTIRSPAFSPDGAQLAFVDDAGRGRVYSLRDGREDLRFAGDHDAIAYDKRGALVRITRDGAWIEASGARPGERARAKQVPLPTWGADNVEIDPATGALWLSSWNGWFSVLGAPADEEPRHGPWHVADLVLDGDRLLTVGPDEQLLSWSKNPASKAADAPRVLFGVRRARVEAVGFVGDDIAVSFEDARVRVVRKDGDARELKKAVCVQRSDDGGDAYEVHVTPERFTTARTKQPATLVGASTAGAVTWNLGTGAATCPKLVPADMGMALAGLTHDARVVVVAAMEGQLIVGDAVRKLKQPGESLVDAAIVTGDDDASLVVVYVDDEGTHAVRAKDGVEVARTRAADIAALPGGRVLLGRWTVAEPKGDDESAIPIALAVWTPGKGAPQIVTREHAFTNQLATSPDGTRFLHTNGDELWLRDTTNGAVLAVIPIEHVEALAFAPDGRFVVSVAGGVTVYASDGRASWSRDARPPT
jgi:hypothetical protein